MNHCNGKQPIHCFPSPPLTQRSADSLLIGIANVTLATRRVCWEGGLPGGGALQTYTAHRQGYCGCVLIIGIESPWKVVVRSQGVLGSSGEEMSLTKRLQFWKKLQGSLCSLDSFRRALADIGRPLTAHGMPV